MVTQERPSLSRWKNETAVTFYTGNITTNRLRTSRYTSTNRARASHEKRVTLCEALVRKLASYRVWLADFLRKIEDLQQDKALPASLRFSFHSTSLHARKKLSLRTK